MSVKAPLQLRMVRLVLTAVALLITACGPGRPDRPEGPGGQAATASAPKRLVAAIRSVPNAVTTDTDLAAVSGADALNRLVNSSLTVTDDEGVRLPQLAEAVPTTENGLWQVFSDGRMETTWRIRQGTRWHDLQPLVAADYAFAARVRSDREIPIGRSRALTLVEAIETPDERTVTVRWKQPFIDADTLFSDAPLPAHILERVYVDAKENLVRAPYWTEAFVGTGPYRVGEFSSGSHVLLQAFDEYVLGKPRISDIEVRFIPDGTTLMANVLSSAVQMTFGSRNLSYEEATQARDQWRDGTVVPHARSTFFGYPQFLNPTPTILANVQFRRALVHAIDREELANTFQGGLVPHGYLSPDVAEFQETQTAAVRYEYDPRRTAHLIESLGYTRDGDGLFRDASNQRPVVEARTTTASENQKVMLSVVDYWQRAGVAGEPHTIPQARAQDAEYRANYPAFEMVRAGDGKGVFAQFHSAQARLPENNYRGGPAGDGNRMRYLNPELDALMDRYAMTILWRERMAIARQIIRLETDQVVAVGLIYSTTANMVSNRLENVTQSVWNAHLWDTR